MTFKVGDIVRPIGSDSDWVVTSIDPSQENSVYVDLLPEFRNLYFNSARYPPWSLRMIKAFKTIPREWMEKLRRTIE